MNRNEDFSDIYERADEYLAHHGIKGMKWGKWNEETRRRYGLGSLKASVLSSKVAKKAGSAKADLSAKIKNKYEHDVGEYKEKKARRKELGMKRSDYDKLRKETLKSHNPEIVAKGMHTLTDEELKEKIRRLQEEDKIAKMASKQKQDRYNAKKARSEAFNANPLVSFGREVVKDTVKDSIRALGYDVLVEQGAKPVLTKKVEDWSKRAQAKLDKQYAARDKREQDRETLDNAEKLRQQRLDYTERYNKKKSMDEAAAKRRETSEETIAKIHEAEANRAVFDEAERLRKERVAETERVMKERAEREAAERRRAQTQETIDTIKKQELRSAEIAENRAKAEQALRNAKILEQRLITDEARRYRM